MLFRERAPLRVLCTASSFNDIGAVVIWYVIIWVGVVSVSELMPDEELKFHALVGDLHAFGKIKTQLLYYQL